ncbi:Hypothetical protein A7982_06517 [Minicystis rosea]|nr:Hypothetical protein A7982_06517 [Minicystis rosea]
MLGSSVLELIVFPFGVLYLILHAGPLFRLWYEPSIRGGTRWQFFASEVVLFTAWILGSPVIFHSAVGRVVVAAHLGMHVLFSFLDYFRHDFMLGSALTDRRRHPLLWVAKEGGLAVDTATHTTVVGLVAASLHPLIVAALTAPALAAFAWVTRGYLRRHRSPLLET